MPRTDWPEYRTVRDLVQIHHGLPALIMGGGSSLADSVHRAPRECVHISANDHGARFLKDHPELERRVDYIVACDKQMEKRARFDCRGDGRDGSPWNVPVVTRHYHGDFRLLHMQGKSSGMAAAYLARLMGCAPILLTGMDCYVGATYYDDAKGFSTGRNFDERTHVNRWLEMVRKHPAQYRAIGCAPKLAQAIGVYDPQEKPEPVTDDVRLLAELNGVYVRFLADANLTNSRGFKRGDVVELTSGEAADLVKRRSVARLNAEQVRGLVRESISNRQPAAAPA